MANTLPAPPYQSPMVDARGIVTPPWQGFFREMYARLGGASGQSNTDLAATAATLEAEIATLEAELENTRKGRAL